MRRIFDSETEMRLFEALQEKWSDEVNIFYGLPLRNLIDYEVLASHRYSDFLLKTSMDFVVCEKVTGGPVLAIEFDGLGHGYSNNNGYHAQRGVPTDPKRGWKLDTKLELCRTYKIPLIVISFDEISIVDAPTSLTILDGIIGKAVGRSKWDDLVKKRVDELHRRLEFNISPNSKELLYEDLLIGCEVELDHNYNPISVEISKIISRHVEQGRWIHWKRLECTEINGNPGWTAITTIPGTETEISKTVALRDFNCAGVSSLTLSMNIAELLLYREVDRLLSV